MSKEETLKPYFQTVREQELDKFWHDKFEKEIFNLRRAEIMALAGALLSGGLMLRDSRTGKTDGPYPHSIAEAAIEYHAAIEAALAKEKIN